MYNTTQDLLDAYRATPETLQALLRNYSHSQAASARGGNEGWSVVEVVCHLRDAEERALERTRSMRDTTNPKLAGYDQAQWAIERNYAAESLASALAGFMKFRAAHIQELSALSTEQWERTGQHIEAGIITISGQIAHLVAHDAIHLAQIARQLSQIA